MSLKLNPPVFSDDKNYERYKQELIAWREITNLEKTKQGIAVALSLPEHEKHNIRERVFDELSIDSLKTDQGFDILLTFLDKHLGKDDLVDSLEKYADFEDYKRKDDQTISEFISGFDSKCAKIVKKGMTLLPEILAFKLLKCANISDDDRMLVLTGMNYENKATLYDQAKISLKKFKGSGTSASLHSNFKLEPLPSESVLAAAGYYKFNRGAGYRGGRGQPPFRGFQYGGYRGRGASIDKFSNPKSYSGRTMRCHGCGSFRHLLKDCPDSWENVNTTDSGDKSDVLLTESAENVVMYTGYDKTEINRLGKESQHSAVLDTACTSTVCGKVWYETFISTFPNDKLCKIKEFPGTKSFKFGGGECLQSLKRVHVPCVIAEHHFMLEIDIVDSSIPLLLSLKTLKSANVKLDLEYDEAGIFGKRCALDFTSSGHYSIPIASDTRLDEVFSVQLNTLTQDERYKALLKLHRQFAHPSKHRLMALLTDAGVWDKSYLNDLDQIYNECKTCKVFAKTPARPVVSMPLARRFNECVAMDLKVLRNGHYILHMIDMFSRLSVSVFIHTKQPKVIIDQVMKHWVSIWGVMENVLFDNGGEFSNDLMREVASILGVQILTTPAESPWSNGVCERNHQVTDRMLEILCDENPTVDKETLLAWANMAKNSLQMWNGFSSFQIILGQNPNLPNIVTGKIPYIEGTTSSDVLLKHLNALHSARLAFIRCESDEKLRRALRHQIRANEDCFSMGDIVFYKREGHNRWLGPAKVIFQDGRVVFVRHGGVYVRVSTNRLIKDCQSGTDSSEITNTHRDVTNTGSSETRSTHLDVTKNDPLNETVGLPVVEPTDNLTTENVVSADPPCNADQEIKLKKYDKIQVRESEQDDWETVTILSKAGKATGSYKHWYNVQSANDFKKSVDLENIFWKKQEGEILAVFVPLSEHGTYDCVQAKLDELQKLEHFKTYEVVNDIGQDRISTRWVVNKKGGNVKVRLVARGFEEEQYIQSDSPTVGKSTMRTFLAISASFKWKVRTTDIKSAFLQGKALERDVFLSPPREAGLPCGKLWKLNHCLYGLNDAARQFYQSVREELLKLGCKQSFLDPALFYYKDHNKLVGLIACHVDDFLHAGNTGFDDVIMNPLRNRFLAGKLEKNAFSYIGFNLAQAKTNNCIMLDQTAYMDELNTVKLPASPSKDAGKEQNLNEEEMTLLRTQVGKINWAVQGSRPDLAFDMIELSTKLRNGTINDLKRANKCILKLKEMSSVIKFPNLGDPHTWTLLVFSDASLGNICNGVGSVGAHLILLVSLNQCCPLNWQANKIKRVVRSTIAAETLSLQEALEDADYLKHLIEELLGSTDFPLNIPVEAVVDNKSVVEAVFSTKMVDDKRLRLDISAIKESLSLKQVKSVKWCPSELQLANCMTKKGASGSDIISVFRYGKINQIP